MLVNSIPKNSSSLSQENEDKFNTSQEVSEVWKRARYNSYLKERICDSLSPPVFCHFELSSCISEPSSSPSEGPRSGNIPPLAEFWDINGEHMNFGNMVRWKLRQLQLSGRPLVVISRIFYALNSIGDDAPNHFVNATPHLIRTIIDELMPQLGTSYNSQLTELKELICRIGDLMHQNRLTNLAYDFSAAKLEIIRTNPELLSSLGLFINIA